MNTVEHWFLRVADSDMTWFGLNWLRPAKHNRLSLGYILLSSILLGLPGIALGAGMIYLVFDRVDPSVWLSLFVLAMMIELPLHILFAHFWNRRAERLAQNVSTA